MPDIKALWNDDITFCPIEECRRKTCKRNQMNIRDKTIPHSFFVERPPDCPYRKRQDDFYHIREKKLNARKNIIREFELFVSDFHPASTSDEYELDMLKAALTILKEQQEQLDVLKTFCKADGIDVDALFRKKGSGTDA